MPKKQSQENDLTQNQEHLIAFLVIALFGLMYWFFMHGDGVDIDAKSNLVPAKTLSVDAENDKAVSQDVSAENTKRKEETEARREAVAALDERKAKEAEDKRLSTETEQIEGLMRNSIAELKTKLVNETKLKQEALEKLEVEKNGRIDAEQQALKLTGNETKNADDVSKKIEDVKQLVETERNKSEEITKQLQQTQQQAEIERNKAENTAQQLVVANQLVETERAKSEETTQQLAEAKQLLEAEQLKAEEIAEQLKLAKKQAELEGVKAKENAQQLAEEKKLLEAERLKVEETTQQLMMAKKLAEFKESQEKINANKMSALNANIDVERNKAEKIAKELAEAKQLAETERLNAIAAAEKLAELKQSEADKTELLAASVEAERVKAEKIAQELAAVKKAEEAERIRAEDAAQKIVELEKLKAEEQALRIEEERQRKLAESEREKAEQALAETKNKASEAAALELAKQKSELEQRIKIAQDALQQKELDRLSFSLADGRTVQIDPNSVENKLKTSIITEQNNNEAMRLDKVLFASGSAELNRQSLKQVEGLAAVLNAYNTSKVLIRGHTDSSGDASKNMTLSLERSMQIKKKLVSLGVNTQRVTVEGLGSEKPVADNATPEGRRENRRIDLILLDK